MAVCVILDADPDYPEDWRFLKDDEYDGQGEGFDNRTFPTAEAADIWIQNNARVGWCTRIVGDDD